MFFFTAQSEQEIRSLPQAIQRAVHYAATTDFSRLEDGRQEIDGALMYANLFHLTSKSVEETHPELHRRYIDVQYWLSGEELFGAAPAADVGPCLEAHEEDDLYFYDGVKNENFLHAGKGCFAVFFPTDAHRPGIAVAGEPTTYRKVVVKVSIDLL